MSDNTPRLPLSVCILVHRFDERLEQAVLSATRAEEILLISTDTLHHFGAVRQLALEAARFDWVLFLDSDEVITEESWEVLTDRIADTTAVAAEVVRSDLFHGQKLAYGEAGEQILIRLVRQSAAEIVGAVHEKLEYSGKIVRTDGKKEIELLHLAHPSISDFFKKISWYSRLVAQERSRSFWRVVLELAFFPIGKFFYNLFFRLGILDGWRGVTYATMMSLHSALVRIYQLESLLQTHDATA